jgi:hypothetical protein
MRGKDEQQLDVFSNVSLEQRVPQDRWRAPVRIPTGRVSPMLEEFPRKHSQAEYVTSVLPGSFLRKL